MLRRCSNSRHANTEYKFLPFCQMQSRKRSNCKMDRGGSRHRKKEIMQIIVRLRFTVTDADGAHVAKAEAQNAGQAAADAIQNRLMGEGFLPGDMLVDEWDTSISVV